MTTEPELKNEPMAFKSAWKCFACDGHNCLWEGDKKPEYIKCEKLSGLLRIIPPL